MSEEAKRIIIPDEEGNEHLFEELFTFTVDATGKSYILVTPFGEEEEEEVEVFAFRYEEHGDGEDDISLFPVETEEEWEMIEEMLETVEYEFND